MVKHEPELHMSETAAFADGWLTETSQGPVATYSNRALTKCFVVAGTGFETCLRWGELIASGHVTSIFYVASCDC